MRETMGGNFFPSGTKRQSQATDCPGGGKGSKVRERIRRGIVEEQDGNSIDSTDPRVREGVLL